ncbi:MAG: hypothetical protein HKL81_08770 [Acidimicrobiaceae bacterium]|nr:hypothetical protein [Acidimicrobiaceae bacterium]
MIVRQNRMLRRLGISILAPMVFIGSLASTFINAQPAWAGVPSRVQLIQASVQTALTQEYASPIVSQRSTLQVLTTGSAGGWLSDSTNGVTASLGIPKGDSSVPAYSSTLGSTYYNPQSEVASTEQQLGGGSGRIVVSLLGPKAPNAVSYPMRLSAGASLKRNVDGSVSVNATIPLVDPKSGTVVATATATIGTIAQPWAIDSMGRSLPTSYSIAGGNLVQHVDTSGAAYPVTMDPTITWGWVTGTIYFNKVETMIATSVAGFSLYLSVVYAFLIGTGIGTIAAAVIFGAEGSIAYTATRAWASGQCLYISAGLEFPPVQWGAYSGGYCT